MRPVPVAESPAVAEVQGLYGAFSFPEKLLQKIWLRGDFDGAGALTTDGHQVRVLHPGKWNLLGGPDFLGARLRIGGAGAREITGDIEVHLRAGDWQAHGHARDPAYDHVVLHVVLFPPERDQVTLGADGRVIPVLVLLPLLHRALEEFAGDEAVEALAQRPASRMVEELGPLARPELEALLTRHAEMRWRQKVHFARLRLDRLGWDAACHHAALEILGYRFNRAPMLRVAARWPLAEWGSGAVTADEALAAEVETWSVQGVRPANHPRVRLAQYAAWVRARPDWPTRVRDLARTLPVIELDGAATREVRRVHGFTHLRAVLGESVCADAVGGTRFDNLVCDGLLPLIAAREGGRLAGLWHHWFPGDLPPAITGGLRRLAVFDGRARPACHGAAQGLVGWLIEREAR
ncbi:MAG: DUF2851 family protein [Opitutaceae bacterium]|nr:DUF2851 family protein [Opitutaceae bacterium]